MTMYAHGSAHDVPICGLYYHGLYRHGSFSNTGEKNYLPQVEVKVHANILATTSRTVLQQNFVNPSTTRGIREARYAFPLYDGVSVVGFSCQVGDRFITGEVKEKTKAKAVYRNAIARGETAGLLEQLPDASDVFTTTIGNIPPSARVVVNVTYLGELKHDMEVDGIRFTIPTRICPRYSNNRSNLQNLPQMDGTLSITVDVETAERSFIQKLESPSHFISMSMGTTSAAPDAAPSMDRASATLTLGIASLDTDFVLQVVAKDTGVPKAILETHPSVPNHRALMATLVPKFALPSEKPEVVFVCDQSGSMDGNMGLVREALQVFMRSLPVGVKFNICSFGSNYSFFYPRSVSYSQDTLTQAIDQAKSLRASFGGTEMLAPIKATIENRYTDMPLNIILLTDGEIWDQQSIFHYLNEQVHESKAPIRVFTLGIGSGVSHALIEGIAKAGNGFSQSVQDGEKMTGKVVRMLKGALSPHVNDYTLEVKYSSAEGDDDFEIVEKVADSLKVKLDLNDKSSATDSAKGKKPISLFSEDLHASPDPTDHEDDSHAHLPSVLVPNIIQAPQSIPPLFAFNRTTVYLLLGPEAPSATPTSVVLRGTSAHGPLELEIPIQVLAAPGTTIHQLAAKKAISELEQGRGWLASATDADGQLLKTRFEGRFSDMVEREAVRLGVQFQVGGKWCAFVATEKAATEKATAGADEQDWEFLEDEEQASPVPFSVLGDAASQRADQQRQGQANRRTVDWKFPTADQSSQRTGKSTAEWTFPPANQMSQHIISGQSQNLFSLGNAPAAPGSHDRALIREMEDTTLEFHMTSNSQSTAHAALRSQLPPPTGNPLQDYQMGLMICEQQSRNRLKMVRAPAPTTTTATNKRRASAELSKPDASGRSNSDLWATSGAATPYGMANPNPKYTPVSPVYPGSVPPPGPSPFAYKPTSPRYAPTSPGYAPASLNYAPTTFAFTPTSPRYAPTSPRGAPTSPGYAPASPSPPSPGYSPTSPCYSLASPIYEPNSPGFAPASQGYAPMSFGMAARSPSPPAALEDAETEPGPRVLAHQEFSGAFPHSPALLKLLGVGDAAFEKALQSLNATDTLTIVSTDKPANERTAKTADAHASPADAPAPTDSLHNALTTALAILFLQRTTACAGEWDLVIEKAQVWLESAGAVAGLDGGAERILGVAEGLLSAES